VRRLVAAGVAGYVLKDEIEEAVVRAIHTVMQGDTWFSRSVVDKLARPATSEAAPAEKPPLTERELRVLQLLMAGKTDQQIGQELNVVDRTVRRYLRNIYDKLGVDTRVEAAAQAVRLGWIRE